MRQGVAADPGLDVFKTAEIEEAFHGSRREIVEMIRRVVEIQFSGQGAQHPDDGGRVGPAEKNETARFEDSIHLPQEGQRIVNVFYNVKKGDYIKGIARKTDVLKRFRIHMDSPFVLSVPPSCPGYLDALHLPSPTFHFLEKESVSRTDIQQSPPARLGLPFNQLSRTHNHGSHHPLPLADFFRIGGEVVFVIPYQHVAGRLGVKEYETAVHATKVAPTVPLIDKMKSRGMTQ